MPPLPVPYRNVACQILTNVSPVRAVCVDSNGAVEGDPTRRKGGIQRTQARRSCARRPIRSLMRRASQL